MQQPIKTFGVKEFSRPASEVERHVEEITFAGYTILPDLMSEDEVVAARTGVESIYQQQIEEIGGRQYLETIGDTYTAMCLLAYDDYFLKVATKPRVLAVVERLLGDYFTIMLQNGIINVPDVGDDQTAGLWHRDLGYQHFVTSRPLGVTALFCLDDFSEETGATRVLPASHKAEVFPSEEYVRQHELTVEAPAGSAIVLDAMLYHRSGRNTSGRVRRGVNNIYTQPLIKQQISLPKFLKGKHSEDGFLRKLLGYESDTDESVIDFRRRRLKRIEAM
jgi:ectoine hydroxylase-related dioxygenase (phytanoyl-CoA dioxygenase family)